MGVSLFQLEAHYLCGGDPFTAVDQLIEAQRCRLELEWARACAIDLATLNTEESLSQAIKQAKSSSHDRFEIELSSSGKRSWILAITVSHKVNLSCYLVGAGFPCLKERFLEKIRQFYETKKDAIHSSFPIHDLKTELLESSLDIGTKLTITDIDIEIKY